MQITAVKLADFGSAQLISKQVHPKGTPLYLAPEAIKNESISELIDSWSLGVTLSELLTGRRPYESKNKQDLYDKVLNEEVNFMEDHYTKLSIEALDLIDQLMCKRQGQRLTAE